jgi:hypothetical protein
MEAYLQARAQKQERMPSKSATKSVIKPRKIDGIHPQTSCKMHATVSEYGQNSPIF